MFFPIFPIKKNHSIQIGHWFARRHRLRSPGGSEQSTFGDGASCCSSSTMLFGAGARREPWEAWSTMVKPIEFWVNHSKT